MERNPEMVKVFKPFRLIDAESYEHTYWRRDGVPLANGYYVVIWPGSASAGRFDEDAVFRGPFRDRKAAEDAQQLQASRARPLRAGTPRGIPAH